MDIALLNVKVVIQKNSVVVDAIGNHINEWAAYYSCYATVSGESGNETAAAGTIVENADLAFTIRYCKAVDEITTDGYRIFFGGEIYNILAIDHMNYKKKSIKFKCQKVRR